ncbi:MAG TPA: TonB-dependent receptor [Thermoanaerobaculia bacterium]|nr:TonB-dependent receptor [Thermoanaerobaculia bacterium]
MNVKVVTASKTSERLSEAPATVIVISRKEIRQRGYTDLSEVLDDLPGMDVIRPYGDTYLKDYWRGYRNTIGDPFLLMVDGVIFNHLYFNTADVMVTFPLSNVERVEIVYGPASSIYGANAFMGVINVITLRDESREGSSERVILTGGEHSSRIADVSYFYKSGDMRFSLTGRFDNGELDPSVGDHYEYTKRHYFSDRALWGGFVDNPSLGGDFSSSHRNRAIDMRAYLGGIELGFQYYRLDSGYGVEYAGDRAQNNAIWSRPDLSAHLRRTQSYGAKTTGTTLLRYRSSSVSNDSYFVESSSGENELRRLDFSYWESSNTSVSAFQDFDIRVSDRLSLTTGIKYEQKKLQKEYEINYGPALRPDEVDATTYPYPPPASSVPLTQDHLTTEDWGVYLQSSYHPRERHHFHLGIREDHNSRYGNATTIRAGYVGNFGKWCTKALYGQAFEEPNNRLLYGGWDGSGSDPTLRPERSSTIELNASRTTRNLTNLLSVYYVQNHDTFINTTHAAKNLGDRTVSGLDYSLQAEIPAPGIRQLKAWGSYSRIFSATEKKLNMAGDVMGTGRIGDLAYNKVHLGLTALVTQNFTASLRGRWVGDRATVDSNPVRKISGYSTLDAAFRWDDLFARGVGVSLKVTNLTNTRYAQPGIRDANAGITPGSFDAQGIWRGSGGFFSSVLPQPGRAVLLTLSLDSRDR